MKYFGLGLLILSAAPAVECAQWIRLSSTNFELYTTASEDEARETLETFEYAREFFLGTKSFLVTPGMPVVLVAFSSAREYKPYSPREDVPAYFADDQQRDYIIMSDLGAERTRVAIHEYVHVLVKHSGLNIPLWLNEGLAEVYAGMKDRDGKILLGYLPNDRAYSLGSGSWMRIASVLNARRDSPEYTERTRGSMFYAQSSLLAHMLMLGEGYAGKFSTFVNRIASSASPQAVFAEVYGKSLGEVEKDMLSYFRQNHIGGATYRTVTSKADIAPARHATDVEVDLTLARIVGLAGRLDEAKGRLEKLSAAHPGNREVEEARAYLAWRSGDRNAALEWFEQALARGGSSWKTYWDYARLLHSSGGKSAQKVDALRKALDLKPEFAPARMMLGRELYARGRRSDALTELRLVKDADPRDASDLFLLMAHAAAELGESKEARQYAEAAKNSARLPEEATRADAFLRQLDHGAPMVHQASESDDDGQRPILRRRAPPKPARRAP